MPEANNEAQRFHQNLIDIGFGEEMVSRCVLLKQEGRTGELLLMLKDSRRDLLTRIHAEQKQLDCLDYLVHQLNRGGRA
ncbi:MAG: hypothetical protein LUC35_03410 [Clostridiales bacterium]|nr:hypothetical protein [Clostridiales bacterium]MCD8334398.1 hypothetical protein [Clostridiales bacterium]